MCIRDRHYENFNIKLWGIDLSIKVITNWEVAVDTRCLNLISKIINIPTKLSTNYNEYKSLMSFLTATVINLMELIDLNKETFGFVINEIYSKTTTATYKEVLIALKDKYAKESDRYGRHVVRYLLLNLKEEIIEKVLPYSATSKRLCEDLYVSSGCVPFENKPFISDLLRGKTSEFNNIDHIVDITNEDSIDTYIPYITLKNEIKKTGEIYFEKGIIATDKDIIDYNNSLDDWEKSQGYQIKTVDDFVTIDSYERTTISILKSLISFTEEGNKGQKEYNASYLKESKLDLSEDKQKEIALKNVFVNSRLMLIYGAAGTGKTTLINYISNMMPNHKKLFLTKTHTAKQNLKRRIENPGVGAEFISLDSFTKKVSLPDYDIIFVDECSTIDNRIMRVFLDKVRRDALLVFAGDIYQIESIEFGNWFLYAKDIINTPGANVELLNTWRTKEPDLIGLWDEVRHCGGLMTEKLSMDGPFSEDIGENVFAGQENDEVVLCLNYDGKFGLNNMNSYFQSANTKGKAVVWQYWIYKVGDPILFNDTKRFTILYNNLKGRIVDVEKVDNCIWFTIDVAINITEDICKREGIEWISAGDGYTRIKFEVQSFSDEDYEKDASLRMMSIVPFQLAYAVSIHKAQGLEYDSVKVVIPRSNSERITHGIFYTAITRAKKKLKIYWSSETMEEIVSGFEEKVSRQKSFEIVKKRVID